MPPTIVSGEMVDDCHTQHKLLTTNNGDHGLARTHHKSYSESNHGGGKFDKFGTKFYLGLVGENHNSVEVHPRVLSVPGAVRQLPH